MKHPRKLLSVIFIVGLLAVPTLAGEGVAGIRGEGVAGLNGEGVAGFRNSDAKTLTSPRERGSLNTYLEGILPTIVSNLMMLGY